VNAREGVLDKPAAMTAAGAPENAKMPVESRFEARDARDAGNILLTTILRSAILPSRKRSPFPLPRICRILSGEYPKTQETACPDTSFTG